MAKYYLCFGKAYLCISENNWGFIHNHGDNPRRFNCEDPLNEEALRIFMEGSRSITKEQFEVSIPIASKVYRAEYEEEVS